MNFKSSFPTRAIAAPKNACCATAGDVQHVRREQGDFLRIQLLQRARMGLRRCQVTPQPPDQERSAHGSRDVSLGRQRVEHAKQADSKDRSFLKMFKNCKINFQYFEFYQRPIFKRVCCNWLTYYTLQNLQTYRAPPDAMNVASATSAAAEQSPGFPLVLPAQGL